MLGRGGMSRMFLSFKKLGLMSAHAARAWAKQVWLTPQRAEVLVQLHRDPLIQRDLALVLGVTRSVVSRLVTALEKLGLVRRKGVKGDRRLRLVTLSDHGISLVNALIEEDLPEPMGMGLHVTADLELLERYGPQVLGSAEQKGGMEEALLRQEPMGVLRANAGMYKEPAPQLPRARAPERAPWRWPPRKVVTELRLRTPVAELHRGAGYVLGYPRSKYIPLPPRTPDAKCYEPTY